jgi:peptidoglycan/LPS O-acetylase OafA/YrhL
VSIKEFYIRRVLRIFPPMYLVIGFGIMLVLSGIMPAVLDVRALLLQCVHLTNYYFIGHGGAGMVPGLELYWSLAVEEHFYLVFPLIFVLGYGRLGRRRLAMILSGAALMVLLWRIELVFFLNTANFYRTGIATDTRIDSILWGCILALWRNPALDPATARPLASGRICIPAALILAFAILWPNERFRETLRYTLESLCLMPLFCAVVLRGDWLAVRWLDIRVMRWLGRISYTFYLCHYVFIDLFELNFPGWPKAARVAAALASALIFSQAMRVMVEIPLARIRKRHGGA